MKKSFLAVALLGAFGAASAESNVTVYGTLDAGVSHTSGSKANGSVTALSSGQQSYSRIGVKGNEALAGGLNAFFVLESGIQLNNGTQGLSNDLNNIPPSANNSALFSSQALLGLKGNFGQVKVGRQFTPLYETYGTIDPFSNGFAANINNFFGTAELNQSNAQRMSSAVSYSTPDNAYGVKGTLAYGLGGVAGSFSAQSQLGASLSYVNGPLTVAYAFHQSKNDLNLANASPNELSGTFRTQVLGATYDLNVVKLHAAIDQNQRTNVPQAQTYSSQGMKTQDLMLGVSAPFGQHNVFASFTHKKDKVVDRANSNQYAVGYTYDLSKRTNFYAAYTLVKNGQNGFVNTEVAGNTVKTAQVGVRHSF